MFKDVENHNQIEMIAAIISYTTIITCVFASFPHVVDVDIVRWTHQGRPLQGMICKLWGPQLPSNRYVHQQ